MQVGTDRLFSLDELRGRPKAVANAIVQWYDPLKAQVVLLHGVRRKVVVNMLSGHQHRLIASMPSQECCLQTALTSTESSWR